MSNILEYLSAKYEGKFLAQYEMNMDPGKLE
jgi:hypothetical protein